MTRPTNPSLARLDVFVGTWQMEATMGGQPLGGTATATFEWLEDSAFLLQRADAEPDPSWPEEVVANMPFPTTTIIGLDDASGQYHQLYADARGVYRVYQMSFEDRVWQLWREAPGFHQRFNATVSADGTTITGAWELSEDGSTWSKDFDITFKKTR
jgi:hypothetical protein